MSRRRKILIVAGIALGVAVLIPVIHHYQLRFAVANYIAELKAKGEPMDLAQVIPPLVPPENNGVPFITNALARLKSESIVGNNPPPAMRSVSPGKAMIGWQQPDIRNPQGTNLWEDLGRELATAKDDLDSFQSLTNHPVLDFNLDYQKLGLDSPFPQLASFKRAAQWLSAAVLYDLQERNPKYACADAHAMLALVKGAADERIIISQLVRIAIAAIGANATWEILQSPDVSEHDLAQLQQDWQALEFNGAIEQAITFERVENLQEFEQTRNSSEKFNVLWGSFYYAPETPVQENMTPRSMLTPRSLFLRKWDELRWRWFWSYQDELRELQAFNGLKLDQNSSYDLRDFYSQSFNGLASAKRKATRIETARNIVVAAIALKRYELRHHQLPITLDQLTPNLLPAVPVDCMDGQPLRYRQNADGTYLLYSVGANGVDDGGNPSLEKNIHTSNFYWQNDRALDWVWPQPATPEEIKNYYAQPPK